MFFTWFNAGVRMVDVRDPYKPQEVGYFIPARNANTDYRCDDEKDRKGCVPVIQMNNVEVDERGYVYAVDRANSGLFILEVTGDPANWFGLATKPPGPFAGADSLAYSWVHFTTTKSRMIHEADAPVF